jgi:hypothetical protein
MQAYRNKFLVGRLPRWLQKTSWLTICEETRGRIAYQKNNTSQNEHKIMNNSSKQKHFLTGVKYDAGFIVCVHTKDDLADVFIKLAWIAREVFQKFAGTTGLRDIRDQDRKISPCYVFNNFSCVDMNHFPSSIIRDYAIKSQLSWIFVLTSSEFTNPIHL